MLYHQYKSNIVCEVRNTINTKVDYSLKAYMRDEECDESREEWRENGEQKCKNFVFFSPF